MPSIKELAWTFGCVWTGGAIALGLWGKDCVGDDETKLIEALHMLIGGAVAAGTVWVLVAIAEVKREDRRDS